MIKLISHLELICYVHLLIKEAFRGISIQLVEVACQNKILFYFNLIIFAYKVWTTFYLWWRLHGVYNCIAISHFLQLGELGRWKEVLKVKLRWNLRNKIIFKGIAGLAAECNYQI
jgi:hypothetical protein